MTDHPQLLNDDGSASMATMFMMSHHGLRRDLLRFEDAFTTASPLDEARFPALREEWQSFRATLHGHHFMEDSHMFPHMRESNAAIAPILDTLIAQHHELEPLLARGDGAFAALPLVEPALEVVRSLRALLEPHLALEEEHIVPLIRGFSAFPAPTTDAEADTYAQGFAWSSHGIAPDISSKVDALLSPLVTSRLPAARAAFRARCIRVWGSDHAGDARTPIPVLTGRAAAR